MFVQDSTSQAEDVGSATIKNKAGPHCPTVPVDVAIVATTFSR